MTLSHSTTKRTVNAGNTEFFKISQKYIVGALKTAKFSVNLIFVHRSFLNRNIVSHLMDLFLEADFPVIGIKK